jgi:hypothetical protein
MTMTLHTTSLGTTALGAAVLASDERNAFWHHYDHWVRGASDAELSQLQSAVGGYGTTEVRSLASIVRDALQNEGEGRRFPTSFLARLQAANWPHGSGRAQLN